MKKQTTSILLATFGLVLAIAVLVTVGTAMQADPVMLKRPEEAQACAEKLMAAVCAGDYDTASQFLYGDPDFAIPTEMDEPAADLMWDAYRKSFSCKFLTDTYADDMGLATDVAITCLDLSAVIKSTQAHAKTLLNRRIDRAESTSEIYDGNQEYREEILTEILRNATIEALQECAEDREVTALTLHMVYDQEQWWVMAETELLQVLSGDIVLLKRE